MSESLESEPEQHGQRGEEREKSRCSVSWMQTQEEPGDLLSLVTPPVGAVVSQGSAEGGGQNTRWEVGCVKHKSKAQDVSGDSRHHLLAIPEAFSSAERAVTREPSSRAAPVTL